MARELPQIGVAFDEYPFEPALEHVPNQTMAMIKMLGINAIELAHTLRQVCVRRCDHEMEVLDISQNAWQRQLYRL